MRKVLAAIFGIMALALIVGYTAGGPSPAVAQTTPVGSSGWFHADCTFLKRAPLDPIVFFGQSDTSHLHDFFGADIQASSTNESIRQGSTSCIRDNEVPKWQPDGTLRATETVSDFSGYWVPAMVNKATGEYINPSKITAGYAVGKRDYTKIQAFPPNLRIIAGDSSGQKNNMRGWRRIYNWDDYPDSLRLELVFPDCWDGLHEDSANHMSHMAYSQPNSVGTLICPPSHPKLVPSLIMKVVYPTTLDKNQVGLVRGSGANRTIGGLETTHGDFMNGWVEGKLEQLVRDCHNVNKYCGGTSAPVPGHS